jgi:hypothetical protein
MRFDGMLIVSVGSFLLLVGVLATAEVLDRDSKHFSLFSVVTFKNDECTSDTTLSGGARAGTCYSATECSDKSGQKSGNCASGFGVCCVFLNTLSAASTITENRTWIRNKEYPSYATATTAQSFAYTVNKMSSDICQIRLDFEMFQIAGPGNSNEQIAGGTTYTHCTRDTMVITTTEKSSQGITDPGTICGSITGEHLYFDLTPTSADAMTITMGTAVTGTGANQITPVLANRIWDFKVSQIPCYASYRAPAGCQRYLMTDSGKITSLNFRRVTTTVNSADPVNQNTGLELAQQRLNTCVRRSKGMCCVEYQLCQVYNGITLTEVLADSTANDGHNDATWNEAWSIDLDTDPVGESADPDFQSDSGLVDSGCTGDYVEIPSSFTGACGANFGGQKGALFSRYCGSKFGANPGGGDTDADLLNSSPVCDCSEPFRVTHMSDLSNDTGGAAGVNVVNAANFDATPRGFCIDYKQTPCWN